MKIAIIGYDREGRSSYNYYAKQGHELTICDQNVDLQIPAGVDAAIGPNYLDNLDRFDVIVRTPGLPTVKILERNPTVASKITSQCNEFMQICPTYNIIGVTGTKGKGTTSTLITKMLEAAGKSVVLGGNIGIPPLDLLPQITDESWVVLELSSFQLSDLRTSPHIAVCLMIAADHLNWHVDMADYAAAKAHLFAQQTPDDIAIYYAPDAQSRSIAASGQAQLIPYYNAPGAIITDSVISIDNQRICATSEVKLLGEHNLQNICAAVTAVWQITRDIPALRSVITSFSGLPFRIEYRGQKNAIAYYNDSYASAPPAPLAALDAVPGSKVVILGGFDRDLALAELAQGIANRSNAIVSALLIGASKERLAAALERAGFTNYRLSQATTMLAIVQEASALAKSGQAVLLSPGFASFDMFKDFEDRGQQFNAAVESL